MFYFFHNFSALSLQYDIKISMMSFLHFIIIKFWYALLKDICFITTIKRLLKLTAKMNMTIITNGKNESKII